MLQTKLHQPPVVIAVHVHHEMLFNQTTQRLESNEVLRLELRVLVCTYICIGHLVEGSDYINESQRCEGDKVQLVDTIFEKHGKDSFGCGCRRP